MNAEGKGIDHRRLHRVPCRVAIRSGGELLGEAVNISLGGTLVSTERRVAAGELLDVVIELPSGVEIKSPARVTHTRGGLGLEFGELPRTELRTLRRFVVDLTSVVVTRETALRSHRAGSPPIQDLDRILGHLSKASTERAEFTLISDRRPVREVGHLSLVDGEPWVKLSEETELEVGETVLVLFTHDFISYSFESRLTVREVERIGLLLPSGLFHSERRENKRRRSTGLHLRLPLPWVGSAQKFEVVDESNSGLGFVGRTDQLHLLPGTPLPGAALIKDGVAIPLVDARVRNLQIEGDGDQVRVGISHGTARSELAVERTGSERGARPGIFARAGSWARQFMTKASFLWHRRVGDAREDADTPIRVVRFPNRRGEELVGLVDLAYDDGAVTRCPLVIVVPGFGGRKEVMSGLAHTLVDNFRRSHADLAVLRFDGSNNLGESHKCAQGNVEGRWTYNYTVGGCADDLRGALDWARNNAFVQPTDIVVISVSFSSVAVRHVLAQSDGAGVSKWISTMGAADVQDALLHVSGHNDYLARYIQEGSVGLVTLLGCLVEGDNFFRDLSELGIGRLEDGRREMASIGADITWIRGEHDAFMDGRRVLDLMSVASAGARELVDLPSGHVPSTSDQAIEQFELITQKVWRHLHGSTIRAKAPSPGLLFALGDREWSRVRRRSRDRVSYWREYLLGGGGPGYDIMQHSEAFRGFMDEQARLLQPQGKRVLDLGAGTGNLTRRLIRMGCAELIAADLVPEALERIEGVQTVVVDIEGGPYLGLKRWLAGELTGVRELVRRVPALSVRLGEALSHAESPLVHALLRGAELDPFEIAASAPGLAQQRAAIGDLGLLARWAAGRLTDEQLQRQLEVVPASVVESRRGLPFASGSFDAVALSLVISYVDHPADALFEVRRVLAPGGRLVISSMRRDADSSGLFLTLIEHFEAMSEDEIPDGTTREELLEAARGFLGHAAELFRLEEEGVFRFYTGAELARLVAAAGFVGIDVHESFGTPSQAVVVSCRRP